MKFIIATNNNKKLKELREILNSLDIEALSLAEAGFLSEVDETGTTFEENAVLKAKSAMEISGLPAIADDSGLETDALHGEPGVYSARYGGEKCRNDTERYLYLLDKMKDVPDALRGARFVSAVACLFPDGRRIVVRGECPGAILRSPRGEGGFGYDPVFYIESMGKTMAELTHEQKNKISHRGRALVLLHQRLKELLKDK